MDATLIRFRQIWVSITRTKTNSETCFSCTRVHDTEPPLTGKLHLLSEHVPEQCIIGNNAGATTTAATTTTAVTAATTTTTTSTKTDKSFKWVSFILSFKIGYPSLFSLLCLSVIANTCLITFPMTWFEPESSVVWIVCEPFNFPRYFMLCTWCVKTFWKEI